MATTEITQVEKQLDNVEKQIKHRSESAPQNPELSQIYQSLNEFTQLFKSMVEYEKSHSDSKMSK